MIHAIRNGQKANFSEHVWELLPPGKEGWEEVKAEAPAEVKAAVKAAAPKGPGKTKDPKPEAPAEVKAAEESQDDLAKGGAES